MKKIHRSTDINTEDTMGRIPMGETLAQEEKPWISWHQYRRLHGRIPMGETLTWRKPTALLTSARKTPWAEFLWANAHMKKIPDSNDVNTEDTMGRIPMGETLTWRKPTALLTSARKTPWAEFLLANAHMKKIPDSNDINTEDTMGRTPMGETLTWRKPTALLTSARKTPWAEFLLANAHMKKNHGSTDVNIEDTMGRIHMGETLVQNLMGHLIGNS